LKLETLRMRSDNSRFSRKENRGSNMATEGRRYARRKELWSQEDIDEELTYIKREIVRLKLKLWQNKKMIYVCEPETGRGLDDFENELGSAEDLKNCHEGREEIPDCQEGNELRSLRDLTACQEDIQGISHCQLGNDKRSLRDLEDCQVGSGSISDCQVGRNESSRLFESLMDSEESLIQQGVLMEMGSVDLIVCQEGSGSIPYFQVGRDD
jgi:hypothetical protein